MKTISKIIAGLGVVLLAVFGLSMAAQASTPTYEKYNTTFTYLGDNTWGVTPNVPNVGIHNIGQKQSWLCADNNVGPGISPCVVGKTYTTTGDIFGDKSCVYIQGDGPAWDTVPNTEKEVCSPNTPTPQPTETVTPTPEPTNTPTPEPTNTPTPEPTNTPTPEPTVEPTPEPTPTVNPTPEPTVEPTPEPTVSPEPTPEPSVEPSETPTPVETPAAASKASQTPTESPRTVLAATGDTIPWPVLIIGIGLLVVGAILYIYFTLRAAEKRDD